jgi:hypothetical protein
MLLMPEMTRTGHESWSIRPPGCRIGASASCDTENRSDPRQFGPVEDTALYQVTPGPVLESLTSVPPGRGGQSFQADQRYD